MKKQMKQTKRAQAQEQKREYKSNVIQFTSVKKTRTGYMVVIGHNVLFLNSALLNFIDKSHSKKAS